MKISPIQTNNFIVKNQNKVNHNYFIKNRNFTDSVSFKGDEFSPDVSNYCFNDSETSNVYSNEEIYLARLALYLDEQEWKDFVYNDRNKFLNEETNVFNSDDGSFLGNLRGLLAGSTLFISEIPVWFYRYFNNKLKSKKWVEKIDLIRTDILNAQTEEKAAELKKQTLKNNVKQNK